MRAALIIFCILLLAGCASQIMQGYVGKDMREVMLDYGAPANAFDMGDGRRAFQWVINSSYTTPTYATTTGTVNTTGNAYAIGNNVYGNANSWVNSNTVITGGQTINSRCVYTMFGVWSELKKGWDIVGFKQPRLDCE